MVGTYQQGDFKRSVDPFLKKQVVMGEWGRESLTESSLYLNLLIFFNFLMCIYF